MNAALDRDLLKLTIARVEAKYKLTTNSLWKHAKHVRARAEAASKPPPVPPPAEKAGITTTEAAASHATWLKERITAAVLAKASEKDIAALSGQYTNALKTKARLEGSLDVTMVQIVRAPDFQKALEALREIVGDEHTIWKKWQAKLAELLGYAPQS